MDKKFNNAKLDNFSDEVNFSEMKITKAFRQPDRRITFTVENSIITIIPLPENSEKDIREFLEHLQKYFSFDRVLVRGKEVQL